MKIKVSLLLLSLILTQSCASVRYSYKSLIDKKVKPQTIYMTIGETREALSVSDGLPGWWGYYPTMITKDPKIVSVICKKERSWIPFRNPGVTFGGTVCYITANKVGEVWLEQGNKYSINNQIPDARTQSVKVIVTQTKSTK